MRILIGTIFLLCSMNLVAGEISVIVNKNNPTQKLTPDQVRDLFLKNTKSWMTGENVSPYFYKNENATSKSFNTQVLNMSTNELFRHWVKLQYQKAISPPDMLDSETTAISKVKENTWAIAFVETKSISGVENIKTIYSFSY